MQIAEEISSAVILWEDLLQTTRAKLAVMPELQEMEKLFLAELDEIEEISWSKSTMTVSSLWQRRSVRHPGKQPPAKLLVKGKVVS